MLYLEVIPLRKLPPQFSFLDYSLNKELGKKIRIGQLVSVPFKNRNILAIANKIKVSTTTPKEKIRSLERIVSTKEYLTANQLALFNFLANYYYLSPALFIKTLVPRPPQRESQPAEELLIKAKAQLKQKIKIEKILENKFWIFLHYQNYLDRFIAYLSLVEKILENPATQILLLVPTKKELREILGHLLNRFPRNYLSILTSELSNNQLYREWQKIKNNQARIIIGTKIATFAPFKNLELIIVDQEHDENFKQSKINPRYDSKIAIQTLAKLSKARLIFCSFAPSLDTYWQIKNKKYKFIALKNPKISLKPIIIDLKLERAAGNWQLLSTKLIELIKLNLNNNKKIFLFHNRRGYSPLTICTDCGEVATCPKCQLTLSYHYNNNKLACHRCNYQQENWLICPHCQSPKIKQRGSGTEKLQSELQRFFPQENILIYDADYRDNLTSLKLRNSNIIIGTKYALENLDLAQFNLIGVVLVDYLFNQGDYRVTENTFLLLRSLLIYPAVQVVLQTLSPNNYVLKYLTDLKLFYQEELAIRQKFNYPPFYQLAKLIFKNKNENLLNKKVNDSYEKIKDLPKKYPDLEILTPLTPFPEKVNKNFRKFIIIKYQKEAALAKIINLIYSNKILLEKSPLNLMN